MAAPQESTALSADDDPSLTNLPSPQQDHLYEVEHPSISALQPANQSGAAASTSSSPPGHEYDDATFSSLPTSSEVFGSHDAASSSSLETRQDAARPEHNVDASCDVFVDGAGPSSEENEIHERRLLSEDICKAEEEQAYKTNTLSDERAKVQNTLKEAHERICQLVQPKQEDAKNSTVHFIERLMQKIEDKSLIRKLVVSVVSFYKSVQELTPWRNSLKEIEGKFGSAVLLTFIFLRFVFFLNVILAILWLVAIVIPFWKDPPSIFSWKQFFHIGFKNFFQGNGLEKSWVYYGGYFFHPGEQSGWYKTAYMYPCTIIATFLVSWIAILTRIARRLRTSSKLLMYGSESNYPFCTLVFGSWDFAITSQEAASRLRKGLRMRFREKIADIRNHEKRLSITDPKTKSYKRYIALGMLWPFQIAANVTIVVFLVSQADKVNQTFKTDYAQSLLLTTLSMVSPLSIPFLVKLEDWNPATSERVVLIKLFTLRLVNACTLFYRLYMALAQAGYVKAGIQVLNCMDSEECPDGFTCCSANVGSNWNVCTPHKAQLCMPGCIENIMAKQLLRLMLTNTLVGVLWDFVYGITYKSYYKIKRQLSLETLVIDIVYLESLVWVGSSFSPIAPLLGLFCNYVTFSYMKFSLRRYYGPMKKPYSASRTSNLTHGLLLLALILCSLPASASLVQKTNGICGPIAEGSSMYQTLSDYIEGTPTLFRVILQWLGNPVILIGLLLLLSFGLIVLREKLVQNQFLFQARYKMFTTCCLLTLNHTGEHEKIRLLSKKVIDS
ncbi:hypothetical protein KP509_25G065300 [Ceratopteris richardii]|uniref:TMC domain-containing protein n=1 Tax=Ceratopteris richardii TaxID=49495 RepID=A0A8T2RR52_CERRI|nr:hypothetical protein KP509_25G065300 [Ceratopteris richardii]